MTLAAAHIIGCGAATAIGCSAPATATAARARVTGFAAHKYLLDLNGDAIVVAAAPWLDPALPVYDRIESLLFLAIGEALSTAIHPSDQVRMVLALPRPRPGLPANLSARVQHAVSSTARGRVTSIQVVQDEHAAGLLALSWALRALEGDDRQSILVAAVDSWLCADTLEWLNSLDPFVRQGRRNPWVVVRGEAAAAVVLSSARRRFGDKAFSLAELHGVAVADEPSGHSQGGVCMGIGLTQALHDAAGSAGPMTRIRQVFSDMNGQPYRADEYGFATLRIREWLDDPCEVHTTAEYLGDVGAASGVVHCALAASLMQRRIESRAPTLFYAGSDSGARAAALMGPVSQRGGR